MDTQLTEKDLREATIQKLASYIYKDWRKQPKGIKHEAKHYLYAMTYLKSITDKYGSDSGKSIVLYFLSNASQYRGELARMIKKELNRRAK